MWNLVNSGKVYFVLLIPVMCIFSAAVLTGYQYLVSQIPVVRENDIPLYRYRPFSENNNLAKLDEESNLSLTYDLPVLDGATALFPLYASFAQAVYSMSEYKETKDLVLNSRTNGAYENLLQGQADIIFCAQPSQEQMELFLEEGKTLKMTAIGREALVFFVNIRNPVNSLTTENIRGVYSGKIKNWLDLHGQNQIIRVFQRPPNSGSQTILEKIMDGVPIAPPRRENVMADMGGIINQVAVYRNFSNAIGYSFLYFSAEMVINDQIKLLSIDGVYPSRETIQDNSYPFTNNFYAIYTESNTQNRNIELFISWILSRQGQELIQKTGYAPINRY